MNILFLGNVILVFSFLGTFQVTTKQQVLGTNAITSLLYNPTKIAHDSFSAPHYLLKMQLPPFYNVADFSQKVLGYRC